MKITLRQPTSIETVFESVKASFPQYAVTLKRNPVARFQYVQVRKSAYVGNWIRINKENNKITFINAIPSFFARAFAGGLLVIAFVHGKQSRLRKEVAEKLAPQINGTIGE